MEVAGEAVGEGYHNVRPGNLACIVTALEMREPPAGLRRLTPEGDVPVQLVRWKDCAPEKYRALYKRVGGPWLWWSRLVKNDEELAEILNDSRVQLYALVDRARVEVGILELDFRVEGECEIVFFGLIPGATGKGLGKWLMRKALQMAWAPGVSRVWLHSCTTDDPRAVPFYMARGFVPFARYVEVYRDPRLCGLYPEDAAPQIALVR
ncbi:GNAT family N-acetyltransferase [Novosphingobium sp. MMS21-SN21R]|nr:GNAT family N-acetyltransferase [Novosphingobium sp. MMS21-SN21R]MDT0508629.1 GNAT family N-acetyltransferase [Novosphingobium sp. MMS21-SN21R]